MSQKWVFEIIFGFLSCNFIILFQFGETKEQLTNAETISLEYDVSNNTEFSLVCFLILLVNKKNDFKIFQCKLGCNSHEYTDLNLAAFRYGQLAYQKILTTVEGLDSQKNNYLSY